MDWTLKVKKIYENTSEKFYLKEPDPLFANEIQKHFKLTELTSRILANRGFKTIKEVSAFLSPRLKNIPDPFLFEDMPKIVERIYKAISENESILIYGDYDVDGITSTALILDFFKHIQYPVSYYIPNRFQDGYGLNLQKLLTLHKNSPFTLLITVDCGTSNDKIIHKLRKIGVDAIITDHHHSSVKPANAVGVLNPSIPGCSFPCHELSGVGVAFFLLIALRKFLRDRGYWLRNSILEPDLRKFLDLVSLGTVADMVPVKNINRIFVTAGLTILPHTKRQGLKALLSHLGLYGNKTISTWDVAFQIAPRFNASGRLGDASFCVSFLTTEDIQEATSIATELEFLNSKRQGVEKRLMEQINEKIDAQKGFFSPYALILWGNNWHEGVIGIAASKLVERFGKPTALISFNKKQGKGSLRGVPGTNIFDALHQCRHLLEGYGGHPMAGGLTIRQKNMEVFCETFTNAIKEQLNGASAKKTWELDAVIDDFTIPREFFTELASLAPFGIGNPPPLFMFQNIKILSKRLLKEKHIKITFRTKASSSPLSGIAFNTGTDWKAIEEVSSIIGIPTLNVWNGNVIPQINIKKFLYL